MLRARARVRMSFIILILLLLIYNYEYSFSSGRLSPCIGIMKAQTSYGTSYEYLSFVATFDLFVCTKKISVFIYVETLNMEKALS